jgi:hypothetical protein
MMMFMAFCVGILVGAFLGAVGMFLLIKENREDLLSDLRNDEELEAPWEAEELPEPEEVKYGRF